MIDSLKQLPEHLNSLVLVIPCYNEEKRLDKASLLAALAHVPIKILFVNDGSTDRTAMIINDLSQLESRISWLQLAKNAGKGEAVRSGICEAIGRGAKFVGYWDADLATPLTEVVPMFTYFERDDIAIVLGSRVKLLGKRIERSRLRHLLGRAFASCASWWLKIPVYDTQCGAKLFRVNQSTSALFEQPFMSKWLFDVEILKRYTESNPSTSIIEHPLSAWIDVTGSKVRPSTYVRAFFDFLGMVLRDIVRQSSKG